jgi:serine kinase of HPr protein (carbohydrate metabolism regulator)
MMQPLQATAVELSGRAMLIEGESGTGKSSLALALIDRGARLIGDDGVMLEARHGELHVSPHPNTGGLIEVRNLGLLTMPVAEEARVALVIRLDREAPRFIEAAARTERLGVSLPLVALWPDSPVLAIRAELALAKYGLAWD